MAMNRVQFQRGMSLGEFIERFGTEAQCVAALERARWPQGFRCPDCAGPAGSRFQRNGQSLWQCQDCRKQTSLTSGTPMASTKLPLRIWLMAVFYVAQAKTGIAGLDLSRQLGVCYRTAWRIKHKLMLAMAGEEAGRLLSGLVEIDDAHLGGELSFVPNGQQWANKVPIVMAVSTRHGRPVHTRIDCISSFRRDALAEWASQALGPDARVASDGLTAFEGIARAGIEHEAFITGGGRRAAQHPRLRWVNTVLSNLKTSLSGTHHAFNFRKYARRYLGAFQFRFNRRMEFKCLVPSLIQSLMCAPPLNEHELRWAS